MGGTTITIAVEEEGNSTMARAVSVHAKIDQAVVHRSIRPRQEMDIRDETLTSHQRPHGSHRPLVLQASGLACLRRRLLPMRSVGVITATVTDKAMVKAMETTSMGRHHRPRHLAWIHDSSITVGRQGRMDTIRGRLAVTEVEGIKALETIGRGDLGLHGVHIVSASNLDYV
jgi:hypothetical protein